MKVKPGILTDVRRVRAARLATFCVLLTAAAWTSAQSSQQVQQLRQEIATLRKDNARRMADMRVLEENQKRLLALIDEQRQKAAERAKENQALQGRITALERQMRDLDTTWRRQADELRSALGKEGEARQKSIKDLIRIVSQDMAQALKKMRPGKAAGTPTGRTYTVQPGDTLSAIGKAFEVSVEDLKKANKLTSDTIVPGQMLAMP